MLGQVGLKQLWITQIGLIKKFIHASDHLYAHTFFVHVVSVHFHLNEVLLFFHIFITCSASVEYGSNGCTAHLNSLTSSNVFTHSSPISSKLFTTF